MFFAIRNCRDTFLFQPENHDNHDISFLLPLPSNSLAGAGNNIPGLRGCPFPGRSPGLQRFMPLWGYFENAFVLNLALDLSTCIYLCIFLPPASCCFFLWYL